MANYPISEITFGSNNYILNDAIARAAVTTLIDTGCKNLIGGTLYGSTDKNVKNVKADIPVDLDPGTYILTANVIQSSVAQEGVSCLVRLLRNGTVVADNMFILSGWRNTCEIELTQYADTIRVYANSTLAGSTDERIYLDKPMLCYKTYYDLTSSYVTKLMTTSEIQQRLIDIIDSGAKNYLNTFNATTQEISGVTWTINSDGTVTANGLATANSTLYIWKNATPPPPLPQTINISGIPSGGSSSTFGIQFVTSNATRDIYAENETFTITGTPTRLALRVFSGYNAQNLVFSPMVCDAKDYDLTDSFQPYRPTYQQLYEMVKALQNGS